MCVIGLLGETDSFDLFVNCLCDLIQLPLTLILLDLIGVCVCVHKQDSEGKR